MTSAANFVYRPPPHYRSPQLYSRRPPDWLRPRPSGFPEAQTFTYCSTTSYTGYSLQTGASPAVAVDDAFVYDRFTSPSGYPVTVAGDGTVSFDPMGDTSRQTISYSVWRRATLTLDGPQLAYFNNAVPVWASIPLIEIYNGGSLSLNLEDSCSDAEGDPRTYTLIVGSLPIGTSQGGALITGSPIVSGLYTFQYRALDPAGDYADSPVISISVIDAVVLRLVPSLVGLPPGAAQTLALSASLGFSAATQDYSDTIAAGLVMGQSPSAGQYVSDGTTIFAVISLGVAPVASVSLPEDVPDMISDVSICNGALLKLGADTILTMTDQNNRARTMNTRYEAVRDAELHRRRWKFAIRRATLPALSTAPMSDFSRQFELPIDFIRLIEGGDIRSYVDLTDYKDGNSGLFSIEGRKLLTNLSAPLKIRYIARIVDPSLFNPSFTEALSARLAWENCERLTQSDSKKEAAKRDYDYNIREAIRANAIEMATEYAADDTWIVGRLQ